jgi:hypothetical protein
MFEMEDLEPYFTQTLQINGMTFTLTKVEELCGELAVWISNSYLIYATPYFENIPVPVHVIDVNQQEIGIDCYPNEVDDYERYCKVVQVLAAKILRRPQM